MKGNHNSKLFHFEIDPLLLSISILLFNTILYLPAFVSADEKSFISWAHRDKQGPVLSYLSTKNGTTVYGTSTRSGRSIYIIRNNRVEKVKIQNYYSNYTIGFNFSLKGNKYLIDRIFLTNSKRFFYSAPTGLISMGEQSSNCKYDGITIKPTFDSISNITAAVESQDPFLEDCDSLRLSDINKLLSSKRFLSKESSINKRVLNCLDTVASNPSTELKTISTAAINLNEEINLFKNGFQALSIEDEDQIAPVKIKCISDCSAGPTSDPETKTIFIPICKISKMNLNEFHEVFFHEALHISYNSFSGKQIDESLVISLSKSCAVESDPNQPKIEIGSSPKTFAIQETAINLETQPKIQQVATVKISEPALSIQQANIAAISKIAETINPSNTSPKNVTAAVNMLVGSEKFNSTAVQTAAALFVPSAYGSAQNFQIGNVLLKNKNLLIGDSSKTFEITMTPSTSTTSSDHVFSINSIFRKSIPGETKSDNTSTIETKNSAKIIATDPGEALSRAQEEISKQTINPSPKTKYQVINNMSIGNKTVTNKPIVNDVGRINTNRSQSTGVTSGTTSANTTSFQTQPQRSPANYFQFEPSIIISGIKFSTEGLSGKEYSKFKEGLTKNNNMVSELEKNGILIIDSEQNLITKPKTVELTFFDTGKGLVFPKDGS